MERLIDPKTFRLELDELDCIDKFGYVVLPITKINIALERSTVDAIPVVRCRDCKHYQERHAGKTPYYVCENADRYTDTDFFEPPSGDWYCADGERKGGDE